MTGENDTVAARLPLTPAVFHILLALADQARHGYGIMKEVKAATGGAITMGPGTLYGTLKRMQADGLIGECERLSRGQIGDERRRYYEMTSLGRALARAEAERLQNLLQIARLKKLLPTQP